MTEMHKKTGQIAGRDYVHPGRNERKAAKSKLWGE